MAASSRSSQFTNLHKVLKRYYKPVAPHPDRPVLEHLLFACLLENAQYAVAEEALATLVDTFFDLNEIRVSSIRELSEVMARLPDPPAAANRLKRVLQHVFEDSYAFDLEGLRKKNLGPAVESLRAIQGASAFGVAYVVQSSLGGHAIPLDAGTLEVMRILDLATDKEVEEGSIAGLERAIPKNKGIEFGSLLHQLGADFTENPFAAELREKLLAIDPKAKNRLPKRPTKKRSEAEPPAEPADEGPPPSAETPPTAGPQVESKDAVAPEPAGSSPPKAVRKPPKEKAPAKHRPAKKPTAAASKKAIKDDPDPPGQAKSSSGRVSKRKPR